MPFTSNKIFLSLFSAILLSISWYFHLSIVAFFGFVPLLILENNLATNNSPRRKLKVFGYSYITFLIWNIGVTWWIVYASFEGALLAYFPNALLMSFVFLIFSNVKKRINKDWGVWLFVPIWIAFQYGHSLWDIAWIWLDLGNVFAFNHNWVQWYEFTGSSGGTLWVLVVNILLFQIISRKPELNVKKAVIKVACVIIIPILFSYLLLAVKTPLSEITKPKNSVIIQPNIDPYNEKFDSDFSLQLAKCVKLINGRINSETEYLVLPETFIIEDIDETTLDLNERILYFKDSLIKKFPNLKIVLGASTYFFYKNDKEKTVTARLDMQSGLSYDMYNTALQIDDKKAQIYHKSKLVPGIERMPFPWFFKMFESFAINLGGTSGSLGSQDERTNLYDHKDSTGVAPVVCYESIFSDYVADYIRNNADFIFIITNDGWWENTPGHVQHLNYARLRAIENRRQIARSANTGISCFIDEFGNITQPTKYWEEAVIQGDIYPNKQLTFFTRFGDLISYISVVFAILLVIFSTFLRFKKKS